MKNNKLKITEIDPSQNYEGYLWWSDQTTPKVLNNEPITELPKGNNPFIIEGQLYDGYNQKSYSIRFVDGDYMIKYFDLKELNDKVKDKIEKEYLSNRLVGVSKLRFIEFWRPVKDKLCGSKIGQEKDKDFEGMEVLQPAETVFTGFNEFKED